MRIFLVTLRFTPQAAGFDDAPLRAALGSDRIVSLREHLFVVQDLPHLLCVVTCTETAAQDRGVSEPVRSVRPRESGVTREPTQPDAPPPSPRDALDAEGQWLYDAMRRWRAQTAKQEGVPPYVVLTNRQLGGIAQARPGSKAALGRVEGVGDKKVERYGDALVAMLRPAPSPPAEVTA